MSGICGIAGELVTHQSAQSDLNAMLGALHRRGADGEATHASLEEQVLLGFRWLKTDSTEKNPAITISEDGHLVLVCDGHVFNAAEVTPWLSSRGHTLTGRHSSEVLLHLYEEEGPEGWKRVDAQFSLAIWDKRNRTLTLGRDYLGVRMLYYYASPQGIVFSSEIKSLLSHSGVNAALNVQALVPYLTFINVPTPQLLFQNIFKIPSAHTATWQRNAVALKQYWDLTESPVAENTDESFYVRRTRELHEAAVAHREASAPIGALLSGGNDSSANVALLARAGRRPLHTFTCGLAEVEGQAHYSDLEYARQVAKLAGSVHHEALISANDFIATIPKTIDILDDLVSEPSSVFLYHALQMARNEGLKVVIAGEANDELTCGHREMINIRERYYQRWAPLMKAPRWARKSVAAAAAAVASKHQATLRRAAADDEYFWNFEIAWSDTEISDAVTQATQSQVSMTAPAETVRHVAERLRNSEHGQRDYMNYIVYAMMQDHYFGNLMMGKMDLIASNFGIEVRSPYTEPSYAHFVFNVPAQFKARPDVVKYFFKKAIEGLLPNEIIYRPKQGFRAPVVELFEGPLADWSRPVLLESGLTAAGYLNADHLRHLLEVHRTGKRDYSTRLWTVMVLNLWYERWIRQRSRN